MAANPVVRGRHEGVAEGPEAALVRTCPDRVDERCLDGVVEGRLDAAGRSAHLSGEEMCFQAAIAIFSARSLSVLLSMEYN